ncbi:MAG: carboxypeptidase-like regulatory domain-containing protein [Bacteroidota bacterium]
MLPKLLRLLGLGIILLSATQHVRAQNEILVSKTYTNQVTKDILSDLEASYPVQLFYRANWLPKSPKTISFSDEKIGSVLARLMEGSLLSVVRYQAGVYVMAPTSELEASLLTIEKPEQKEAVVVAPSQDKTIKIGSEDNPPSGPFAVVNGILFNNNDEPVVGAKVSIPARRDGALANDNGRFRLELPFGQHEILMIAPGYDTLAKQIMVIGDGDLELKMERKAYNLNEVVLSAEADDSNVKSVQIGVTALRMDEIQKIPAFLGETDVVKSLLLLPGVSSVGEGSSGFNVRGGNVDQNLIMQDGGILLNSSHVLGFFSLFHSDVLNKVTLYRGHIPAQFGGRLASVLDVEVKDANARQFKIKGGLGVVSSRVAMEIPLIKNQTSLLLGGRASYSDWVLGLVRDVNIQNSSARFSDLTGKLTHRINRNNILSVSAYNSTDFFRYANEFGYAWRTQLYNANWRRIFNNRFSSTTSATYSDYRSSFFDPEGQDNFELENGLRYFKARQQFLWTPNDKHTIHAGAEWINYLGKPEKIGAFAEGSGVIPTEVGKDRGHEMAIYINDEFSPTPLVGISVGLRYSHYINVGERTVYEYAADGPRRPSSIVDSTFFGAGQRIADFGGLEPRLAVRVNLDEKTSVKVSYNRLRQYIHLISNTTASTPVDLWQVSNNYVPPQIADSYSIGLFRNFNRNEWETSLEFYYKDISQLIAYKDLPELLLNRFLETELLVGRGRAYGGELSIKRKIGKVTGWLSYSYARTLRQVVGEFSEETINQGEWFPAPFDKPHTLNLVSNIQFNSRNSLSVNFTYSTGRPITAPIGNYFTSSVLVPHYSFRNQFRIPDYHRMDLSYTLELFAIKKQRYQDSFTFSLYNLYFRRNPFSVFFEKGDDPPVPEAFVLAILGTAFPAITYNFRF